MTTTEAPEAADAGAFRHPALFYRGAEEYLAGTVPFIRAGLAEGEPVAAAVPGPNLALLRAELGRDADRVRLLDMTRAGRNPGRIIPGVLRAFADAHPEGRVRIIGEPIWPSRSDTEYPACLQHEALINLAFAGRPVTILCPYDAAALKPRVLADAAATHPVLADRDGERASDRYAAEQVIDACNLPLPEPAGRPEAVLRFDARLMQRARDMVVERAGRVGLAENRVLDAELAVNELTGNTLVHGGGKGTLRIWAEPEHLVFEVADKGHITDPLAGRLPVALTSPGGRGLLLVNQLADLVRFHTGPQGTTIRVYFAR
ncbi:anti-sigma factor RsbA family regulatory protein [Actinomadura rubrisoli]|uniref:Sensor histidine kinase n=1 Tax=Actinomadura rubrisoli TaxID=2530368 RepID=A0A4R5B8C0_9ACTN|nr:anti-sigma factor RsbA family regulatory protein [Actinomadura rubrisoli]TDD81665.1 sensor histidine kinase [Actinomadura rubrisoli]